MMKSFLFATSNLNSHHSQQTLRQNNPEIIQLPATQAGTYYIMPVK
jgi:hypothetical protein